MKKELIINLFMGIALLLLLIGCAIVIIDHMRVVSEKNPYVNETHNELSSFGINYTAIVWTFILLMFIFFFVVELFKIKFYKYVLEELKRLEDEKNNS